MPATYAPPLRLHRPHVNLWLVAVVGLAAALVALGSWVLVDRYTGGGGATQDATTLVDDLATAVTAGDAKAISGLYASDAVFVTAGGDRFVGRKDVTNVVMAPSSFDLHLERIGPVATEGDFVTAFVHYSDGMEGTELTVFQLKDGKIVRQWAFEVGLTPPFDNAVMP